LETVLAAERAVAINAVLQASKVCQQVFKNLVTSETITKNDNSPVTGANINLYNNWKKIFNK
jgi:3'(2'), 5'-bisphosphate nucleotidase